MDGYDTSAVTSGDSVAKDDESDECVVDASGENSVNRKYVNRKYAGTNNRKYEGTKYAGTNNRKYEGTNSVYRKPNKMLRSTDIAPVAKKPKLADSMDLSEGLSRIGDRSQVEGLRGSLS